MEGEAGGRCRVCHAVAVLLLLCCLAPSFTCFSLRGLRKTVKHDKGSNEAAAIDVKTGSVAFNGRALNFQSGSASAAAPGNDELLHTDLYQSDGTEMLELENDLSNEAELGLLNSSLHCGLYKMKLNFMGLGAADLQVDIGNAPPLPLMQVPETCGYSVQQNELDLELIVPYDGCSVIKENGRFVLQMRWQETPVKFSCPVLSNPDSTPASSAPEHLQQLLKVPLSHRPVSLRRSKRHVAQPPFTYDPNYLHNPFLYNMYMTANPNSTPAHPYYNPYYLYLYYLYYLKHYYHYHPLPGTPPVTTTAPPPTVGPITTTSTNTHAPSTTRKCSRKIPSITQYPGQIVKDVPFHQLPFSVQMSEFMRASKLLENQRYFPEALYKSGFQAPAQSSFNWHPVDWFPDSD